MGGFLVGPSNPGSAMAWAHRPTKSGAAENAELKRVVAELSDRICELPSCQWGYRLLVSEAARITSVWPQC